MAVCFACSPPRAAELGGCRRRRQLGPPRTPGEERRSSLPALEWPPHAGRFCLSTARHGTQQHGCARLGGRRQGTRRRVAVPSVLHTKRPAREEPFAAGGDGAGSRGEGALPCPPGRRRPRPPRPAPRRRPAPPVTMASPPRPAAAEPSHQPGPAAAPRAGGRAGRQRRGCFGRL